MAGDNNDLDKKARAAALGALMAAMEDEQRKRMNGDGEVAVVVAEEKNDDEQLGPDLSPELAMARVKELLDKMPEKERKKFIESL